MKLMVGGLGLMLLACSAFPQSTPSGKQPVQSGTGPNNALELLQNDGEKIPQVFAQLTDAIQFENWKESAGCPVGEKDTSQHLILAYSKAMNELRYMADTVRYKHEPELTEVSESVYVMTTGVHVSMLLAQAAGCTGQHELGLQFLSFSQDLLAAADRTHTIELYLINAEQDLLQELYQYKAGHPEKPVDKAPATKPSIFIPPVRGTRA